MEVIAVHLCMLGRGELGVDTIPGRIHTHTRTHLAGILCLSPGIAFKRAVSLLAVTEGGGKVDWSLGERGSCYQVQFILVDP